MPSSDTHLGGVLLYFLHVLVMQLHPLHGPPADARLAPRARQEAQRVAHAGRRRGLPHCCRQPRQLFIHLDAKARSCGPSPLVCLTTEHRCMTRVPYCFVCLKLHVLAGASPGRSSLKWLSGQAGHSCRLFEGALAKGTLPG